MANYGIIIMWVFTAIGLAFLNNGPKDAEYRRREAYWKRFEDDKPSGSAVAVHGGAVMTKKEGLVALKLEPLKK
jgi:hypothetical protein